MNTTETILHQKLHQAQEIIDHQEEELTALLHSKNQELEEILGNIDQIIWYIDIKTLSLQYVNDAITPVFGFAKEDFLRDHTLWQQRIHPDDRPLVRFFFETLLPGKSQEIRFRIHRSNGEICWLNSRIYHNSKLHLFVGITSDITESKRQSEEIEFLAYNDPLTMLPNRSKLKIQLHSRLEHSVAAPFALIFIDLDNFKNINDTMGHEIGDQILIQVSVRLRELVGDNHFAYRFGGDEFVILFNTADSILVNAFSQSAHPNIQTSLCHQRYPLSSSLVDWHLHCIPKMPATPEDLIKHARYRDVRSQEKW